MSSYFYNKRIRRLSGIAALASIIFFGQTTASEDASTESAPDGEALFNQTCVACHGADGRGALPGVSDLTAIDGPLTKSDAELSASILEGVSSPNALMSMPAMGGLPQLTERDLCALLAYLRSEFEEEDKDD